MLGPFPVVGDCVSDEERLAVAFIEHERIRPGDLGIWFMPSLDPEDQYASKWLLEDAAGDFWLACKYFAVRYRPEFHKPVGRVALIVYGDPGSMDEGLSSRMAAEIRELRAQMPSRADLVVFKEDLLAQDLILATIEQHRRQWVS